MAMLGMLRSTKGKPAKGAGLSLDLFQESFRANGKTPTFSEVVTHSRSGNATMVDSDGLLKWAPHNLALNSASPATQSITVVSGADYTVECTGVSIALSGAGTGTVTEGNPVEITASTTTLTLTVTGSEGTVWAYRSDLGGMVDNPDRGDSYVPTTSSAVYLPRRGHHVYNGSAWVNEGLLHESEARTNLVLESSDYDRVSLTSISRDVATAPDGTTSANASVPDSTNSRHITYDFDNVTLSAATRTYSVFLKAGEYTVIKLRTGIGGQHTGVTFDLSSGTIVSEDSGYTGNIQDYGNGWYRCSSTFTTASDDYYYAHIPIVGGSDTFAGNDSDKYYFWGGQIEAGSTPSSYIPTAGATVTRAAETLTIPSANLPWPTETYGPELVTNGGFDADVSGWSNDGTSTIAWNASSYIDVDRNISAVAGGSLCAKQTITGLTVGKLYIISGEIVALSNRASIQVYNLAETNRITGGDTKERSTGTYSYSFVATETSAVVALGARNSLTATASFDNISVRELTRYPVSIQMDGRLGYADEGSAGQVTYAKWEADANNRIALTLDTDSTATGEVNFTQVAAGTADTVVSSATEYAPGILVPFNIASRHGSTFINGAVDGVALTANTTPTALPDLSSTDLELGYDMMGTIKTFRIWDKDLGDTGIEEATS